MLASVPGRTVNLGGESMAQITFCVNGTEKDGFTVAAGVEATNFGRRRPPPNSRFSVRVADDGHVDPMVQLAAQPVR
jgi:hypothetical protein